MSKALELAEINELLGNDYLAAELRRLAAVEAAAKNLASALNRLDEGCTNPGFRGFQNGNGEDIGNHVQDMREALQYVLGETK